MSEEYVVKYDLLKPDGEWKTGHIENVMGPFTKTDHEKVETIMIKKLEDDGVKFKNLKVYYV